MRNDRHDVDWWPWCIHRCLLGQSDGAGELVTPVSSHQFSEVIKIVSVVDAEPNRS